MKKLIILLLLMQLSGCGDSGIMNITKLPISDEAVMGISGNITDTSVQKEALYSKMRTDRDKLQLKMYAQSGFNVKFKLIEVSPGVKIQMMEEVSFKESPKFEQPLPDGPSIHPAWKFGERVLTKGMDTFLGWTAIGAAKDVLTDKVDASQPKYYGPYSPQTAQPYIVNPVIVQ